VGPKTIEKLMAKYKTISRIKSASESDLAAILGSKQAKTIKEALD
jgi:excinuclease UvrABC nuclease subunit